MIPCKKILPPIPPSEDGKPGVNNDHPSVHSRFYDESEYNPTRQRIALSVSSITEQNSTHVIENDSVQGPLGLCLVSPLHDQDLPNLPFPPHDHIQDSPNNADKISVALPSRPLPTLPSPSSDGYQPHGVDNGYKTQDDSHCHWEQHFDPSTSFRYTPQDNVEYITLRGTALLQSSEDHKHRTSDNMYYINRPSFEPSLPDITKTPTLENMIDHDQRQFYLGVLREIRGLRQPRRSFLSTFSRRTLDSDLILRHDLGDKNTSNYRRHHNGYAKNRVYHEKAMFIAGFFLPLLWYFGAVSVIPSKDGKHANRRQWKIRCRWALGIFAVIAVSVGLFVVLRLFGPQGLRRSLTPSTVSVITNKS